MCATVVVSDPMVVLSSKDMPGLAVEKDGEQVEASSSSVNILAPLTSETSSKVQEEGSGAMLEGSRKWKVCSY